MDRRGFLRFLGLGAAAVVAPTKAYSFLGGILRPRKPEWTINRHTREMLERQINPPLIDNMGWYYGQPNAIYLNETGYAGFQERMAYELAMKIAPKLGIDVPTPFIRPRSNT